MEKYYQYKKKKKKLKRSGPKKTNCF